MLQLTSTSTLGKAITFAYDDLYRLTSASTTAASSTPFLESYTYTALGNLTATSTSGSTYTYAGTNYANPHAATDINGTSLAYDNVGNLTSYGSNTYGWDYRNRLASTTIGSNFTLYGYDQGNQRVTKGDGTATTTYPNKYFNQLGATTTSHIYMPDGTLLATIEGEGTATSTNYVHTDHLGGTNVVTNESGTVVQALDYYPYGSKRISSGNDVSQREYIGQIEDPETSLNYLNARYYNNATGQFLSEDPVFNEDPRRQNIGNPQSLNSYSYSENNPINKKDPDGRFSIEGSFNYQGNIKGPVGVSLGVGLRIEVWPNLGYQFFDNYGGGVGKGASIQGRINPFGTLDPEGEYVALEGVVARGWIGGAVSRQAPYSSSNPFDFGSDKAKTSFGWALGYQTGVSYSNVVIGQPHYFFGDNTLVKSTSNGAPLVLNSSGGAAKVGNSGSGEFKGIYDFGPGIGKYDYGKEEWVAPPPSTSKSK